VRLEDVFTKRVLLISGKGGVGRTTVAAGLALAATRMGREVLLAEAGNVEGGDSPLAQVLGYRRFEPVPQLIDERLWACRLWPPRGHELFLRSVLPVKALVSAALRSRALQAFLRAVPSFEEMGLFYHALMLVKEERAPGIPRYPLVIIDMPATGHALAMTSLPDILLRVAKTGPIHDALVDGQTYLNNPERTAAWVVTLPETLPVSESIELLEGFERTRVPVGGVIVNRLPTDPFSPEERQKLSPVLSQNGLLGALPFHKIARSQEAEARLEAAVKVPILKIGDLPYTGASLPPAVAEVLLASLGAV